MTMGIYHIYMNPDTINYPTLKGIWKKRRAEMYDLHVNKKMSFRAIGKLYGDISAQAVANSVKSHIKSLAQ